MKLRYSLWGCAAAAVLIFAPTPAPAAVHECVAASPAAASGTWDFHSEANNLFTDVQADARQIADQSASLQRETADADLTWITHGEQLTSVKHAVNDIADRSCRLASIRRFLAPWQQQTADRIAAEVPLMVDATEDAINFERMHPDTLWSPTYLKYVNDLYDEASTVHQSAGDAVQYAHVLRQYHELRNNLGVKTSS